MSVLSLGRDRASFVRQIAAHCDVPERPSPLTLHFIGFYTELWGRTDTDSGASRRAFATLEPPASRGVARPRATSSPASERLVRVQAGGRNAINSPCTTTLGVLLPTLLVIPRNPVKSPPKKNARAKRISHASSSTLPVLTRPVSCFPPGRLERHARERSILYVDTQTCRKPLDFGRSRRSCVWRRSTKEDLQSAPIRRVDH